MSIFGYIALLSLLGWLVLRLFFAPRIKVLKAHEEIGNLSIVKKAFMTECEKIYYVKLSKLMPNHYFFPQVSFNAFLTARDIGIRNRFNKFSVDFVLTDKSFNVLAIIEVDDSSHTSKRVKEADAKRDAFASEAGYPTIRINDKHSLQEIRKKLKAVA